MHRITQAETLDFAAVKKGAKSVSGVYGLVDPREPDQVRYVGSSGNIAHRLYSHTHSTATTSNTPLHRWLAELKGQGVKPEALVLEEAAVGRPQSEVRHELESWWISLAGSDLNSALTPVGHSNSKDSKGKKLLAENRNLRNRVAELEREVAKLSTLGVATCNTDATRCSRCTLRRSLISNATQQTTMSLLHVAEGSVRVSDQCAGNSALSAGGLA